MRDPELIAGVVSEQGVSIDWIARMRDAGVTHVVVSGTDRSRLLATLTLLLSQPEQYPFLHLDGRVAVFGWRDPQSTGAGISTEITIAELDRLALRPSAREMPPLETAVVARRWWDAFTKPSPRPSGDADEATIRNLQAEVLRQSAPLRHADAWRRMQVAGLIASTNNRSGAAALLDANVRILHGFGFHYHSAFAESRDDSPVAVLYLAIRAARRAIAADPSDALAHAALGEAYLRLLRSTRERAWSRLFSELVQLRRTQAAAALNRAIALDPNLAFAHFQLATLYYELGFLDLALDHNRAFLNSFRRHGAASRIEGSSAIVEAAQQQLAQLAESVGERQSQFDRESAGMRVLDRATLARDMGLAGKARDILLASDISAFGAAGLALELELLLRTGRVLEVREWTSPEQEVALGPTYHWLRVQALAANGEYYLAQAECTRLAVEGSVVSESSPRMVIAVLAGQTILDGGRVFRHAGQPAWDLFRHSAFRTQVSQLIAALRREADVIALRGLLSLEAGETDVAVADFRRALATWGSAEAAADRSGIDFNARRLCQGALEWIESVPP
jgi:tetratricopeptide (TPR) repeat protein